jgi:hypothetical protein
MNDRLFRSAGFARADAQTRVSTVIVTVHDRGLSAPLEERFVAELESFAGLREAGPSPWEAVRRLVVDHRPLLERRWAPGGPRI